MTSEGSSRAKNAESFTEALLEHWHIAAYLLLGAIAIYREATSDALKVENAWPAREIATNIHDLQDSLGAEIHAVLVFAGEKLEHLQVFVMIVLCFVIVTAVRFIQFVGSSKSQMRKISEELAVVRNDKLDLALELAQGRVNKNLRTLMSESIAATFDNVLDCIERDAITFDCADPLGTYYERVLHTYEKSHFRAVALPSKEYLWDENKYPHIYIHTKKFIDNGGGIERIFIVTHEKEGDWSDEEREIVRQHVRAGVRVLIVPHDKVPPGLKLNYFLVEKNGRMALQAKLGAGGRRILQIRATVEEEATSKLLDTYQRLLPSSRVVDAKALGVSDTERLTGEWRSLWLNGERRWVDESVRIVEDTHGLVLGNLNSSYHYTGQAVVHDRRFIYGNWRSLKPGANSTGALSLVVLPKGEAMAGYWTGPSDYGELRVFPWLLGRNQHATDEAFRWLNENMTGWQAEN
jgi:hypothetical protein